MYTSRFLRDKRPEPSMKDIYGLKLNDDNRKWLSLIPPEHRRNLRLCDCLNQANLYFDMFVPEVPVPARRFCWLHA